MRHITLRALDMLRNRTPFMNEGVPLDVVACGDGGSFLDFLGAYEARAFAKGDAHALALNMPTCPLCRVLLDQALDAPDAKPLDFTGATP